MRTDQSLSKVVDKGTQKNLFRNTGLANMVYSCT